MGGVPTYAESKNAGSVTAPLGYTLLSMSESDDKPAGSYYDITANAWFKPDTAVTDLTGSATMQGDANLFKNSIGTLDQLDTTRTSDDFADFLATIGITNTTQLADSGLSNQDILDMINALDDTVTVTGDKNKKADDTKGTDTVTTTNDKTKNVDTVTIVDDKNKKVDDTKGVDTVTIVDDKNKKVDDTKGVETVTIVDDKNKKVDDIKTTTLNCTEGFEPNAAGTECIAVVKVEECKDGKVRNEAGECVFPTTTTLNCTEGFEPNAAGTACVAKKTTLNCTEGFVPNEAGTECIAVVNVEECKDGKVRDPKTGLCVLPPKTECPAGQTRNAEGKCVPIRRTEECKPGYERINGVCVPVCKPGYERINGVCVPVCQPGYVRVNGVCKKIATDDITTTAPVNAEGDKTDPIYAGNIDDFDLFATLQEVLASGSGKSDKKDTKKDNKKSKDKTKMATGGHLDDLLAEQMTVDDLLKLLR